MRKTIGLTMAALWAVSFQPLAPAGDNMTIKGSGVTKEETRKLMPFRSLDVSSSFEVAATIGPNPSVTLNVDDNLLPFVMTEIVDGVLMVRQAENSSIQWTSTPKLSIVVPALDSIAARGTSKIVAKVGGETKKLRVEADGAGSIRVTGLAVVSIDVKARGVGRVELSGKGKSLTLNLIEASNLTAKDMTFESARIWMEGASRGEIRVTDSIEAALAGASSLKVDGQPKSRAVKTADASSLSY